MRGVMTDEYKIVDNTLQGNIKNTKQSQNALIKWCLMQNMTVDQTYNYIIEALSKYIDSYKSKSYKNDIKTTYNKFKKENIKLTKVDSIDITENEWNSIISANDRELEHGLFIMLVYQKINEKNNPNANGWFAIKDIYLFRECDLSRYHIKKNDFLKKLSILYKSGFISQKNSNKSTSIHINYKSNDKVKFKITNFENVITYYDEYKNGTKYIECELCHKRIKPNKNNTRKYCNECQKEVHNINRRK